MWNPIMVLPIISFVWVCLVLLVTFIMAYCLNHVPKGQVPFISNLGTFAPESGIFTIGMCVAGMLIILNMWCLFKSIQVQIEEGLSTSQRCSAPKWFCGINYLIFVFGVISGIGLWFTGAFRKDCPHVHFIGAATFVIFGILSISVHIILCYVMSSRHFGPDIRNWVFILRCFIVVLCTVSYMMWLPGRDIGPIKPAYTQWIGTVSLSSYILTLLYEFRKLRITCGYEME